MENKKPKINSYKDLFVYQNTYKAMLVVLKEIILNLPKEEKFDLVDQMRRCCKACPALIAEGFAKRYQKRNWNKYLEDAIGEINEMQHHLDVCIDVYDNYVNISKCKELKALYILSGKQAYKLKEAWKNFHDNRQ
ncbi:MAG: four helix bundle protein [Candidatus Moraniibacteriota bacterium]